MEWNLVQEYQQQNIKVQCYLIKADRSLKTEFGEIIPQMLLAGYPLDITQGNDCPVNWSPAKWFFS